MGTLVNVNDSNYDSNQYQIKNAASGMVLGIGGQSQTAGTSVVQETNTNSTDSMWHFMQNVFSSDEINIENMLTHQVIGLSSTPQANGAPAASALARTTR